jgi:hypothetical protein
LTKSPPFKNFGVSLIVYGTILQRVFAKETMTYTTLRNMSHNKILQRSRRRRTLRRACIAARARSPSKSRRYSRPEINIRKTQHVTNHLLSIRTLLRGRADAKPRAGTLTRITEPKIEAQAICGVRGPDTGKQLPAAHMAKLERDQN